MFEVLSCFVIGIADGDTITCLDNKKVSHKIRLAEIDAPEKKQDYGNKSTQNLKKMIYRQNVTVKYKNQDRYGRTIGYVFKKSKDINHQQIKDGMAWFYTKYGKNNAYKNSEKSARLNKIGLWEHSSYIEPWNYRRGKRKTFSSMNLPQTYSIQLAQTKFKCVKKTCSKISSCAEARYLLTHCGYKRLDRDQDGIPCESICR